MKSMYRAFRLTKTTVVSFDFVPSYVSAAVDLSISTDWLEFTVRVLWFGMSLTSYPRHD